MNGNGKKFSEQFMVKKKKKKKKKLTRTRHGEFREILIKFYLKVRVKVPVLIFLKVDNSKNLS